jgi:hypothetical protein
VNSERDSGTLPGRTTPSRFSRDSRPLFTLVGIAGDDDLDAPDLLPPTAPAMKADASTGNKKDRLNGGQGRSVQQASGGHRANADSASFRPRLEPQASAALREQLSAELKDLNCTEEAANWAHRVLATKNSLTAADAEQVEQAFYAKVASLITERADEDFTYRRMPQTHPRRRKPRRQSKAVDKTVLVLPVARRIRDRDHVKSVATQPCLVCGRRPADAHHLRFAQSPALGRKVSDEFTVPLCRGHHREVHHCGDEAAWWNRADIDPTVTARMLWLQTHPLSKWRAKFT